MNWSEEFPFIYAVPRGIEHIARQGALAETSWRNDPAPSFATKLKFGRWLKIWIEHPNPEARRRWKSRFIVMLVDDPSHLDGTTLMETEDLDHFFHRVVRILKEGGRRKFKIRLRSRYLMSAFPIWWIRHTPGRVRLLGARWLGNRSLPVPRKIPAPATL